MLVLTRKPDESILIGGIKVTVLNVSGDKVRIGIDAAAEIPILRGELLGVERAAERPSATPQDRKCA
jgi:carbon storage regulator